MTDKIDGHRLSIKTTALPFDAAPMAPVIVPRATWSGAAVAAEMEKAA